MYASAWLMRTAVLALVVTAFLWGDTKALVGAVGGPTSSNKATASASDVRMEQEIRRRLSKTKLQAEHFSVSVRAGVVILEGRTSVPQRKGAATRVAHTAGAVKVRNLIVVSERYTGPKRGALPANGGVGDDLPEPANSLPRATVLPAKPSK